MKFLGHFINGAFRKAKKAQRLVREDPGDLDRPVGEWASSSEGVSEAVAAARAAFSSWSRTSEDGRATQFAAFRKALERRKAELATVITRETGKPLAESETEIDRVFSKLDTALSDERDLVRDSEHRISPDLLGRLRYRPRGVIAIVAPFNVPAYLALAPAITALASGNAVVVKPSDLTPFTGQILAEIFLEAEFAKGVFNLVQGDGRVGEALVSEPGVDAVIFTGSWPVGAQVRSTVEARGALCALEMGGKNAAIVLSDADLDLAATEAASGAFMTSGQRCNATSRVLVERSVADKFLEKFLAKTDAIKVGYGLDRGVRMGPLASKRGYERALKVLSLAAKEGFKNLRAGGAFDAGKMGYYLKPSVRVRKGAPTAAPKAGSYTDDEAFAPDAAIYVVKDLDEAIHLNNRPSYGLVTSVFTRSRERFEEAFAQCQTGLIHWNVGTVRSSQKLPFGGLKHSGNDRPAGFFLPYLCTVPTASVEREPG